MLTRRGEFYGCPFTAFARELDEGERDYFDEGLRRIENEWLQIQERANAKFYGQGPNRHHLANKILIVHTGCVMLYRMSRDEKYLKQLKTEFAEIAEWAARVG